MIPKYFVIAATSAIVGLSISNFLLWQRIDDANRILLLASTAIEQQSRELNSQARIIGEMAREIAEYNHVHGGQGDDYLRGK